MVYIENVSICYFQLDAFSNPALKSEIERMRREWMQSKENLGEFYSDILVPCPVESVWILVVFFMLKLVVQ
jgi:hypothetical protein